MDKTVIDSYPRYDSYKNSGVDWLGEVPEGWDLGRISSFFKERRRKVSDKDYPALSVTKTGVFPQWDHVAKSNDGDNRKLVKEGDFVINSRSDRKGSSGIAKQDGSVSLINIVLEPKNIEPRFSEYLFKSNAFIEEFYRVGHGIVADLWTTRFDNIKNSLVSLPSDKEQTKIADFLDKKTNQIDQAITLKQQQIAKLEEYKQIVIQNAVTKGLNPDAPMKDSGVDWIGDIPEHWEVKRLMFVTEGFNRKVLSSESELRYLGMESIESKTGQLSNASSEAEGLASYFKKGQILFGKLRPYLAKVYLTNFEGLCSTEFMVMSVRPGILDTFLKYQLLSNRFIAQINSSTYGSKMPRASAEYIKRQSITLPPIEEQKLIVEYIDLINNKVNQTLSSYNSQIDRLKEYKTILINQAVTGKIKVS